MASSDEEDLEALRNAALASLRQKQAAQEPQGIQVLSRPSRTALQTANQYNQQGGGQVLHPEVDYGYKNTENEEVPYEIRQAVFHMQNRGRGRGFHRGRGWNRGRGYRFIPEPTPPSALIVIQPSGRQEEEPKIFETSKDSRPFLLRPQDKWASTESGSQSSTPTRPKEKSKFSRYDDATDSEDDDEVVERRRRESGSANFMDMSLEDVSSDTEIEVHTYHNDDDEVHEHNNEVEVHNSEQSINDSVEVNEKDSGLTDAESAIDMSQNITIDEVVSDLNTSQSVGKSDPEVSVETKNSEESKISIPVIVEPENYGNVNGSISEDMSLANKNIEGFGDQELDSDNTPLRDESTPLRDELRQDDSVSNSYSAFSRFNRRNRKDSESAEESAEESDVENKNMPSSRDSSVSKQSSRSQSLSGNESDANNVELVSEEEIQECSKSQQIDITKISQTPQERRTSLSSLKLSKSSTKSSVASSSSSSESDSESSSSSSTSSSSSDSDSSDDATKKLKQKAEVKKEAKNAKRKSKSPVDTNIRSRENKNKRSNDLRMKKHCDIKHEKHLDTDRNKADHYRSEKEKDSKTSERRRGRERSPYLHHKRPVKDRLSTITTNEVKADPEFDATNYRDEIVYSKRGNQSKKSGEFDRKQYMSRENHKGESKYESKSKETYEKDSQNRQKDYKEKIREKRHFEEIGRLKMEVENVSRKSVSKLESEKSSKLKQSKSESKISNSIDKIKLSAEANKKDKNAKSSKSDSFIASGKASKSSKSSLKDSLQHKSKERRKSDEKLSRKSTEGKSKHSSTKIDHKSGSKVQQKPKRRSIEERLKRIASITENLDSDSDSDKSVSSLSDVSSDSETETWRDKKHGASRKTADIELERRRRELKEREKKRDMDRKREDIKHERGGGDGDTSKKSRYRNNDTKNTKYVADRHERQSYRKDEFRDRRKHGEDEDVRQKYYHKKNMVFYEDDTTARKKFEEVSSDSEPDVRKGGVISVVRSDRKKQSEELPSLLDINVSKPKSDKDRKVRKKSPKNERLIIRVEKSSDEEISSTKSRKKKVKRRKNWSSDEEETPLQQVVNVTFNEETKPKKSSKSVYDRLGVAVNKKTSLKVMPDLGDSGAKRSREVSVPMGGKRIKLNDSGKYTVTDKSKNDGGKYTVMDKSKKSRSENKGDPDEALNLRIQKIQEKNAEILRRKMEIEQDKQKYG